jgi:hypothetical protein
MLDSGSILTATIPPTSRQSVKIKGSVLIWIVKLATSLKQVLPPAMEAGIEKSAWTVSDLVNAA